MVLKVDGENDIMLEFPRVAVEDKYNAGPASSMEQFQIHLNQLHTIQTGEKVQSTAVSGTTELKKTASLTKPKTRPTIKEQTERVKRKCEEIRAKEPPPPSPPPLSLPQEDQLNYQEKDPILLERDVDDIEVSEHCGPRGSAIEEDVAASLPGANEVDQPLETERRQSSGVEAVDPPPTDIPAFPTPAPPVAVLRVAPAPVQDIKPRYKPTPKKKKTKKPPTKPKTSRDNMQALRVVLDQLSTKNATMTSELKEIQQEIRANTESAALSAKNNGYPGPDSTPPRATDGGPQQHPLLKVSYEYEQQQALSCLVLAACQRQIQHRSRRQGIELVVHPSRAHAPRATTLSAESPTLKLRPSTPRSPHPTTPSPSRNRPDVLVDRVAEQLREDSSEEKISEEQLNMKAMELVVAAICNNPPPETTQQKASASPHRDAKEGFISDASSTGVPLAPGDDEASLSDSLEQLRVLITVTKGKEEEECRHVEKKEEPTPSPSVENIASCPPLKPTKRRYKSMGKRYRKTKGTGAIQQGSVACVNTDIDSDYYLVGAPKHLMRVPKRPTGFSSAAEGTLN